MDNPYNGNLHQVITSNQAEDRVSDILPENTRIAYVTVASNRQSKELGQDQTDREDGHAARTMTMKKYL